MGLGLRIGAQVGRQKNRSRALDKRNLFKGILRVIQELISDPLSQQFVTTGEKDGRLFVKLHPAEEDVEFLLSEDGWLICSAKTSSAGPGYHAFLVQLLEEVGNRCDWDWCWKDDVQEFEDETGYHEHRDFQKLQLEMLEWLRGLARMLTEKEGYQGCSICLPLGFHVAGDYFAASPLGYWNRSWFEEIARRKPVQLQKHGAAFFPWYEKGQTAEFWLKCGLTIAWVDLPWHAPTSERETKKYRLALSCFERAKELSPSISMPDDEMNEIELLLGQPDAKTQPLAERIGFRRRLMVEQLTGSWTIRLPGYFYSNTENDGETAVFWFAGRTVNASSLTIGGKGENIVKKCELLPDAGKGTGTGAEIVEFHKDHLDGRGFILPPHGNEQAHWTLEGHIQVSNNLCVTTICFTDIADKPWAIQTWQSVSHPDS